jgi:hypothetical protein
LYSIIRTKTGGSYECERNRSDLLGVGWHGSYGSNSVVYDAFINVDKAQEQTEI